MKRLNFYSITIILVLSLIIVIGVSKLTGYWQTEREATPRTISTGSMAGTYDPYDIRGSYTIAEVLDFFQIPKEDFYKGLQLPASFGPENQLKNLESLTLEKPETFENDEEDHLGVSDVRDFVAAYIGLDTSLEAEAEGSNSAEERTETSPEGVGAVEEHVPGEYSATYSSIRGSTTLAQVYSWGITAEQIEAKFKINLEKLGLTEANTLKELVDAAGLQMYDLKAFITEMGNI